MIAGQRVLALVSSIHLFSNSIGNNADNIYYVSLKLLSCRSCELDTSTESPLAHIAQQPT